MRIIIAGDGEVGLYLAQELSKEDHNITMIVPTEELVKTVESHSDVLATVGDSTLISVLKRANVKKADLLISGLHEERINILTAALGKKIGAIKTIARINTLEYLSDDNRKMFQELGIDHLVCPEEIAANEVVDLLRQTAATETGFVPGSHRRQCSDCEQEDLGNPGCIRSPIKVFRYPFGPDFCCSYASDH